jgi:5-methyltetrahydropteroyltriglutamate--homocysteine methyltransferase
MGLRKGRAAKACPVDLVPLDQLCLSPQCGFSSTVEGNVLTPEEQAAKLRLIVETASEVWG